MILKCVRGVIFQATWGNNHLHALMCHWSYLLFTPSLCTIFTTQPSFNQSPSFPLHPPLPYLSSPSLPFLTPPSLPFPSFLPSSSSHFHSFFLPFLRNASTCTQTLLSSPTLPPFPLPDPHTPSFLYFPDYIAALPRTHSCPIHPSLPLLSFS